MASDAPKQNDCCSLLGWRSVFRGALTGLLVSAAWTGLVGPATEGPPSLLLSFTVYATGFTITGAVIAVIRRWRKWSARPPGR